MPTVVIKPPTKLKVVMEKPDNINKKVELPPKVNEIVVETIVEIIDGGLY